jgi:hypothetical protein
MFFPGNSTSIGLERQYKPCKAIAFVPKRMNWLLRLEAESAAYSGTVQAHNAKLMPSFFRSFIASGFGTGGFKCRFHLQVKPKGRCLCNAKPLPQRVGICKKIKISISDEFDLEFFY